MNRFNLYMQSELTFDHTDVWNAVVKYWKIFRQTDDKERKKLNLIPQNISCF